MSFYLLLLCGFLGGIFGGMGMGGGTALIPLLTIICGVEQRAAQGLNLLSFVPMAAFALVLHAQSGLLRTKGLFWLTAPAVCLSVLASLFAVWLPSALLKKAFGTFLVILAAVQIAARLKSGSGTKKCKKD